MKGPRHRCFPAQVQCGNGGAKILAAEKLGKAVGRWVMQSPDGFFVHVGPWVRAPNCQGDPTSDTSTRRRMSKSALFGRLIPLHHPPLSSQRHRARIRLAIPTRPHLFEGIPMPDQVPPLWSTKTSEVAERTMARNFGVPRPTNWHERAPVWRRWLMTFAIRFGISTRRRFPRRG